MTISRIIAIAVAMMCGAQLTASAEQPQLLDGTWVFDAKLTAEHIKAMGRPTHNAEWLPSILLKQCVTTMTFEGNSMVIDPISPVPMAQLFRLDPQPEKKWTYSVESEDGGRDTLTITFLNRERITVKSEKIGLDEYGVWKRGKRPNRQTAEQDFKQALGTCSSIFSNEPFIDTKLR